MGRHVNIPVFIPHEGCPNACVFCNQRSISGTVAFDPTEVDGIISRALETVGEDAICFGGDIDGIDAYPAGLSMEHSLHEQMVEFLRGRGYSETLLYKLACDNMLRVLEAVCP